MIAERSPRRLAPVLILVVVIGALVGSGLFAGRRPRHLVLIVVDTLRRDYVSAYGGAVPTPNIDRLAAAGQTFTNDTASFHQTTMSMGALFTGRTPSIESGTTATPLDWNGRTWCGLVRLTPPGSDEPCVPRELPTLAEGMRRAGYRTIGVVSNQLLFRPAGFDRGFDEWIEVGATASASGAPEDPMASRRARAAAHVNRAVADTLDRHAGRGVFLYVHFMDAHDWDLHGSYDAAVRALDAGIGDLLDILERAGVLAHAVVVLTSDHGEALGERHPLPTTSGHMGDPSFEQLLRIPLIVAPAPADDPTRFLRSEDVFRLLHRLAGVGAPPPRDLARDETYLSERQYQTYRRGRWKSVRRRADWSFHLFDLEADPGETRDLAARYPEVSRGQARRMAEIARSLAATGDRPATLSPDDVRRLRALGYVQ